MEISIQIAYLSCKLQEKHSYKNYNCKLNISFQQTKDTRNILGYLLRLDKNL